MTDKEKARIYKQKHMWYMKNDNGYLCDDTAVEHWDVNQEQAYLDGLKSGREESEKEIAELKEIISRSGYRIAELKHINDELKAELSDIKTAIRDYSKAETFQQQEITWESLLEFIN